MNLFSVLGSIITRSLTRIGIGLIVVVALLVLFVMLPYGDVPPVPTPGFQVASLNGGKVEYRVEGEGEPILFIHGVAFAEAFLPVASEPALAHYERIRMHRRGYAGSSSPPDAFGIADFAADAVALLDSLGIEKVHLVGHSSGAMIAAEVAMTAPDRVRTLTLMDPPIDVEVEAGPLTQPRPLPLTFVVALRALLKFDRPAALGMFMSQPAVGGDDWQERLESRVPGAFRQAVADARRTFPVELPAVGRWTIDQDRAGRITAPILYLVDASKTPPEISRQLWPDAEFAEVPGSTNHMFPDYQPSETASIVAQFLGRREAADSAGMR